jgi:hypothetical protein
MLSFRGHHRYGLVVVFFVSSFFVTVPSDFSVTVVSLDFTDPSSLTFTSSVRETVRSHPTRRDDAATIDIVAHTIIFRFIRLNVSPEVILRYRTRPAP